jgi:hypothetical protein
MRHGGLRRWALAATLAVALAFPGFSAATIGPDLQFGTSGAAAGQFQIPVSIEVGPNGDIYVGDAGTNRISQFAADGTFIRAWGFDVVPLNMENAFEKCTTATGCKAGTQGGGAGELQSADGIAAAANGDLYVAEFSDNRISQFTANGDFVRVWGWGVATGANNFETCTSGCQAGIFGSGLGQLSSPNSVAVGGGEVYVTETSGNRVSRFTTAGVPIGSFGSFGSGAGQLFGPRGVAIAPGGDVVVVDRANNRISEFTSSGDFVRAWGFGVDTGAGAFETCTTASGCQAGVPGTAAGQFSDGNAGEGVFGIAADPSGDVFLADDGNNRIAQYAPALAFTRAWGFDVAPPDDAVDVFEECTTATGCQQAQASNGPGGVANPADLALDAAGRLLVVDFQTNRVVRYADPPRPTPAITGTDPASPANDANPEVKGTADPGSTVKIYSTSDCSGAPLATGPAATFEASGITTPVPPNATTDLRATASGGVGGATSACSAPFTYTDDSAAPAAPALSATDPGSGSNQNSPKVKGTAESGSTVKLFASSDCGGSPLAIGSAADLSGSGIGIAVTDDSSTQIRATATDPVGNTSACSAPISYVEDSQAPETTVTTAKSTVKTKKKSVKVSFTLGSSEPGSIFQCKLDNGPFETCTSPKTYGLKKGTHLVFARATDAAGNTDETAALAKVKVKRKKKRRHHHHRHHR